MYDTIVFLLDSLDFEYVILNFFNKIKYFEFNKFCGRIQY